MHILPLYFILKLISPGNKALDKILHPQQIDIYYKNVDLCENGHIWMKTFTAIYIILHSDQSIQQCNNEYTRMLRRYGIAINMMRNDSPYDNALTTQVLV